MILDYDGPLPFRKAVRELQTLTIVDARTLSFITLRLVAAHFTEELPCVAKDQSQSDLHSRVFRSR